MTSAVEETDRILCLYCHVSIEFVGLPPQKYEDHLSEEHRIHFDLEHTIQRTLTQQLPQFAVNNVSVQTDAPEKVTMEVSAQVNSTYLAPLALLPKKRPLGLDEVTLAVAEQTPVPKKAKINRSIDDEDYHQHGRYSEKRKIKKLFWFSGCEFQCQVCLKNFFYVEELRKHIKDAHCDPDKYLDKYKQFETKAVFMKCQICAEEVRRHFPDINDHLFNRHDKMSVEEYGERYFKQVDYEVCVDINGANPMPCEKIFMLPSSQMPSAAKRTKLNQWKDDVLSNDPVSEYASTSSSTSEDQRQEETDILGNIYTGMTFDEFMDQTVFRCVICKHVSKDISCIHTHLKTAHNMTEDQYISKHGAIVAERTVFKCPLCPSGKGTLSWMRSRIKLHASLKHEMTEREFYHNVTKKDCEGFITKETEEERHQNRYAGMSYTSFKSKIAYKCVICGDRDQSIYKHVKEIHGWTREQYMHFHEEKTGQDEVFKCPLCPISRVYHIWTSRSLQSHVYKCHKMTMTEFYKKITGIPVAYEYRPRKIMAVEEVTSNSPAQQLVLDESDPLSNVDQIQPQDYQEKHVKQEPESQINESASETLVDCSQNSLVIQPVGSYDHGGYANLLSQCEDEGPGTKAKHPEQLVIRSSSQEQTNFKVEQTEPVFHIEQEMDECDGKDFSLPDFTEATAANTGVHSEHDKDECDVKDFSLPDFTGDLPKETNSGLSDRSDKIQVASQNQRENYTGMNFNDFMNQCVFKCAICGLTTRYQTNITHHVKTVHKLKYKEYGNIHGSMISEKSLFYCPLCPPDTEPLEWISANITSHAKKSHKMTSRAFHTKVTGLAASTLNFCRVTKDGSSFFEWCNDCKYSCKVCGILVRTKKHLISHLKAKHSLSSQDYETSHGDIEFAYTSKHACKICGNEIVQDQADLTCHFKEAHQISLEDYYDQYITGSSPSLEVSDKKTGTQLSETGIEPEGMMIKEEPESQY